MAILLLQLHLTRGNDPPVPLFIFAKKMWEWIKVGIGVLGLKGRVRREI